MSAELYVEPTTPPETWDEFRENHGPRSIALDGYVGEGPLFDSEGPYLNANHHEGVDRIATLATCEQILRLVRLGLERSFHEDGAFSADVYVNDCDQDVCTAWFMLNHIDLARPTTNPMVNRLSATVGILDATAGSYPMDQDARILDEMAWVFQPYNEFRKNGEIHKKESGAYQGIIEDVENRILLHVTGRGESIPVDTSYERIGGSTDWARVREIGDQAKVGMFKDGIDAYVAVLEEGETNRYTIGRRSVLIPFDVPRILQALNSSESCDTHDQWGGSDIVGGSPRVSGSRLAPSEVEAVIRRVISPVV